MGDWLRRMGSTSGLEGLEKVNKWLLKRGVKYDGTKGYTLDMDATGILAEKKSAKMTYIGFMRLRRIKKIYADCGSLSGKWFGVRR